MSDLSDFGGGIEESTDDVSLDRGEKDDGPDISEQCKAIASSGDRCQNAVSHMSSGSFCGPHSDVDDVETIEDDGQSSL